MASFELLQSIRGVSNLNYQQVQPLINVETIKNTYLFATVPAIEGDSRMDETQIQILLNNSISLLETDLDLALAPRHQLEMKDYYVNDYADFGFMILNRRPVISLERLRAVYLQDSQGNATALEIPAEWCRLDPDTGIIRLVPNNKWPARLQVDSVGSFFPELFRRHGMFPNLWEITYTWGFKEGCVPSLINMALGLLTAVQYFNIIADIQPLGVGIAASAISLDGLSQSIQTTASAENTTYSAKVKEYNRLLYGDKTLGIPGIIPTLRHYWQGTGMSII